MNEYTGLAAQYIFNKDNRDHLEHCIEVDKTFSVMMQMLGEVWLGDRGNTYLYIGESAKLTKIVRTEFQKVLEHEGYRVTDNEQGNDDRLFVGDENYHTQVFIFWSINDPRFEILVNGWDFAKVYEDVDDITRGTQSLLLEKARHHVKK